MQASMQHTTGRMQLKTMFEPPMRVTRGGGVASTSGRTSRSTISSRNGVARRCSADDNVSTSKLRFNKRESELTPELQSA